MSNNWRTVPLSEIADINPRLGKTALSDDSLYTFVPMASVGASDGIIDTSAKRPYAEVKKGFTPFQSGDVLFAKITPCMENGKMAVVPHLENQYGFGSTEFHVIRPKDGNDPKYVYYYVSGQGFRKEAAHHMTGAVGQKRVPTDFIKQSLIPLPTTIEDQQQIVAEIEKQFSRLDEAVASLKRIQSNLKRYKAAVLKDAVEGKLTEQWRKDHPDIEPADQLLKRILAERRSKWEESVGAKVGAKQGVSASPGFGAVGINNGDCNKGEAGESFASPLPQMKARGVKPKDDSWKKKYKEPAGPDTANLPELPEGWVWASLQQVFKTITDGDHQPPPQTETGIPFLVIGNVRAGKVDLSDTRFVSAEYYSAIGEERTPRKNDILYTLVGSYGIAVLIEDERPFCIQRHIGILKPNDSTNFRLFKHVLSSNFVYKQATNIATGTAQLTVPLGGLRMVAVPLPPVSEQAAILEEIDRRLSVTEELESTIATNLKRAELLRQTILQRAFSGGLV
ncbi:MAG: restriction endonuclease subunit S [Deltaproteobacteria bacterium]|nr:restriction endonuclease subunit S [Deltaproteobacteria bacterium]